MIKGQFLTDSHKLIS